ncbi:hypothetical protein [Rugamonas apoptosis]|uniref:Uncharacterized protein n=1 Tax=Rugamonas apoptosis TaxID=2758570 RepID=A0A7W2F887_9BURK|nr:hypothetical protein [Rugamonas apoptosis]MBA5686834.1 hypothetical protein [Rugamonas apoptosis]
MKRKIQFFLLVMFCVMGLASGFFARRNLSEPTWWALFSTVSISVAVFWWYCIDSAQKEFTRSFWLNVGVVAIAPIAIPWYVFRSNERGLRLRAVGRVLGFSCLLFLAGIVGGVAGVAIGS